MIKNYTSSVPVDRTISRIESALIRGGAIGISKEYKKGELQAIHFSIPDVENRLTMIRLPGDVAAIYEILKDDGRKHGEDKLKTLQEQSVRTAWKIVQDWVEVQMAFIEMRQAEFLQIFLPYIWDGNQTFYGYLKGTGFKMLTEGKQKERK
jgi:hypothetical protein